MQKRRKPSSSLDGFVPRNRPARRRSSLDTKAAQATKSERKNSFENTDATQPLRIVDEGWRAPDDALVIDEDIDLENTAHKAEKKPHFWQIGKKRRLRKGKPEQSRRRKVLKRVFILILLVIISIGGFLGWKVVRNTTKIFSGNVLGLLDATKLKGEENGRVNILLAGTSEDDPGHDGAKLTDSIMLVSLDTTNKKAFMMSIPRDLWVSYQTRECSVGYQGKINAAYTCGEQINFDEDGYAKGGMGLLEKIVEDNFGVPIHYYAKINYTAFREAVDAVNGIDITLKTDSPNGILDRIFDWECKYRCYKVKYPNGPLHLNGEQALDLARARGDFTGYPTYGTGNDFGRTERQRQMLIALKDKALSVGILSNPAKISSLLDAAGNNVTTDFKTSELRRLYDLGKDIKSQNIQSIGLADEDVNLIQTFTSSDGQSAIRPVAGVADFSAIKNYLKKITSNDPLVREDASIVVLNASGVLGLAQKKADVLELKGLTVQAVGNAVARDDVVVVAKSSQKNATKSYLEKLFGVQAITNLDIAVEAKSYQSDFVIVLGKTAASN